MQPPLALYWLPYRNIQNITIKDMRNAINFLLNHSDSVTQVGQELVLIHLRMPVQASQVFRWFEFTLKPPYTVAHGNLSSAIWNTFHWTSFVKFGLKTA